MPKRTDHYQLAKPLQMGSITMLIAQNLQNSLTLQEIEDLATKLGMMIRHCQGEHCIMKYKLAIAIAEKLLKDEEQTYITGPGDLDP